MLAAELTMLQTMAGVKTGHFFMYYRYMSHMQARQFAIFA